MIPVSFEGDSSTPIQHAASRPNPHQAQTFLMGWVSAQTLKSFAIASKMAGNARPIFLNGPVGAASAWRLAFNAVEWDQIAEPASEPNAPPANIARNFPVSQ